MVLCVYALTVRRPAVSSVRGLDGEPLHIVASGALAAIVGKLPRPPAPSTAAMARYDAVIRALAGRLPAVLPARFGTCFTNPEELEFVLRSRRRPLLNAIACVRNRVQMTVRVVEPRQPGLIRPTRPTRPTRGPGTKYLHARAALAAQQREIAGFDPIRAAVRRWVRDERVEKKGRVASVYHLVPRGAAERYRNAVARAAAAGNLKLTIGGPFPAYAFAEV
jgi:hypothetical protein